VSDTETGAERVEAPLLSRATAVNTYAPETMLLHGIWDWAADMAEKPRFATRLSNWTMKPRMAVTIKPIAGPLTSSIAIGEAGITPDIGKDGGAPAMKTYGYLRREHSITQAQRVSFSGEVIPFPVTG